MIIREATAEGFLDFRHPIRRIEAWRLKEVLPALRMADEALANGSWVAGFISYEAAPGLDPAMACHPPVLGLPLVLLGVFQAPTPWHPPSAPPTNPLLRLELLPGRSRDAHCRRLDHIRRAIADGETYQVNCTMPMTARTSADPMDVFETFCSDTQARYAAYVDCGDTAVVSLSPELFFERRSRDIMTRPMKGTAARGLTTEDDRAAARRLHRCPKNRAENVMVADMLRNDLGRIAEVGSVQVPALFETERYPTLWQMTSTITARSTAPLSRVFQALFPCASVTGAPKVAAMDLIRQVEDGPRGVYTGSIGFAAPDGRACFSVAIRTAVFQRKEGELRYDVGSGVVWDSDPEDEYQECLLKAAALSRARPRFELLETMAWTPKGGWSLLDAHRRRLQDSSEYHGFKVDWARVRTALDKAVANAVHPLRVRLTVDTAGRPNIGTAPLPSAKNEPIRLDISPLAVDATNPFLYHKTTFRQVYEDARAAAPLGDDTLLCNTRGEVTETCIANIAALRHGLLTTPPVSCGLLPGVRRNAMLEAGELAEGVLTPEDLRRADAVFRLNAVRGLERVVLPG